jgi:putative DNA-binding phage protein
MINFKDKALKRAVGTKIQMIRLSKGMTLEEFGKLFGAAKSIVYRWEKGQSLPRPNRLKEIADFAGITVLYLLEG